MGGPGADGELFGWLLPIVYAYFTLSVISPLVLMSVAELQKAPPAPQPIASPGGGGARRRPPLRPFAGLPQRYY